MPLSVNLTAYAAHGGAPFTYNTLTTYVIGDVVDSAGTKYKARTQNTNSLPANNTSTWVPIVEKTIGSASRDYVSVAAWIAAMPNLIGTGQIWKGILYKEGAGTNNEWSGSIGFSNKNTVTDADRFPWLEPAPGQSFINSPTVRSNALRYDPANGVAISNGTGEVYGGDRCGPSFIRGLQLKGRFGISNVDTKLNAVQCIVDYGATGTAFSQEWGSIRSVNTVYISSLTSNVFVYSYAGSCEFTNCTFIGRGGTSQLFESLNTNAFTLRNNVFFGFNSIVSNSNRVISGSSSNNVTDLSSIGWTGAGNRTGLVAASQLENVSPPYDLKLKVGSNLQSASRIPSETNNVDITNYPRLTTFATVGAYEQTSMRGNTTPANIRFPIRDANGNPTSTSVDMGDMFLRKEQYLTAGLWMWGSNQDEYINIPAGQLGTNDNLNRSSPTQIGTLATWRQVSCGYRHSAAIKTDGTLWAWGENVRWGEVGISNNTARYSSPVQVGSMTDWKTVACSYGAVLALKTNGTLWAWGRDAYGELGQNNTVYYSSPVQVGSMNDWKYVTAGSFHVLAIKTDGKLWAWGEDTYNVPNNASGRLGLNYPWFAFSRYSSPVQVGSLNNWRNVAATARSSAAIKQDGTLWTWGTNFYGQLGLNNIVDYSSPVQVGSLTNWRSVSGGRHHFAAITTGGRLYMWGRNTDGDLGLGNTVWYSSPMIVGSLTNWKQVSCGYGWTAALKTDGTLWVWGRNLEAQLGLGNIVNYSSPVQVGTLTSWKSTVNGGCGYFHTGAIQSPDLP